MLTFHTRNAFLDDWLQAPVSKKEEAKRGRKERGGRPVSSFHWKKLFIEGLRLG